MTILIGLTIYIIIAAIVFYSVVFTDKRILQYDFVTAAKRFSSQMTRLNKAIIAVGGSITAANTEFKKFNMVFKPMISEYENKYGPRPAGEPFLEWAIRMEKGGS